MEPVMKLKTFALSALVAAGAVIASAQTASAAVVCNRYGDCWRTSARHDYRPAWGLRVYDDNWRWHARDDRRYRWRDAPPRRGYWGRGGVWITF
jgi:hypothetical protein